MANPAHEARVSMQFTGDALKVQTRSGLARGLNMAAERLRAHSVERAPIDEGDLRGNATVESASPANLEAVLVFPDEYAAKQHQDETLHHTPGAAGEPAGEARFVAKNYEDAARAQEYRDLIGTEVNDAWR